MKTNWFDKKVLVLGLSKSGVAAAKYLNKKGADVYISEFRQPSDDDKELINKLEQDGIRVEVGQHSEEFLEEPYLVVTSPGIAPDSEVFQRLASQKVPVISEVQLAYNESQKPFIAITGTNGKTTTTALTAHILASDFKTEACGNIGLPPCELLENDLDYYVCEMSSFQIQTTNSMQPQISCWLNFTPDHINWHGSLENYFNTKAKIFKMPQKPAFAVFNALDKKLLEFSKTCTSEVFLFGEEIGENCCWVKDDAIFYKRRNVEEKIIDLKDCPLVGEHNYQNIMCSVIVAKLVGVSNENIVESIKTFKAPEHRLEYVCEINGTKFYNDSKATNPESSIVAIKSFEDKNVVLIAGGRDKNTGLDEFCDEIKKHIKTVVLIGEATQRFEENLKNCGYENIIHAQTLQEAVDISISQKSDIVLLSPACASFDMFTSFEERGKVFKEYVLSRV